MKSLTIFIGNTQEIIRNQEKDELNNLKRGMKKIHKKIPNEAIMETVSECLEESNTYEQIALVIGYVSLDPHFKFKGHVTIVIETTPMGIFCQHKSENEMIDQENLIKFYKEVVYSRPELLEYKLFQQSLEEVTE